MIYLEKIVLFLVGDLNSIEFNFDPRCMIPQVRTNPPQSSHYNPLISNDKFVLFRSYILIFN